MNLPQYSKEINDIMKNKLDCLTTISYNKWKPNTSYIMGDIVKYNDLTLICKENHTSSEEFFNDSKYWDYNSKKEFY